MKRHRSIEAHFTWLASLIAAGSIALIVAGMAIYMWILDKVALSDLTPAVERMLEEAARNPKISGSQLDALYRKYVYVPPDYQPFLVVLGLAILALMGAIWVSRRSGRQFARPVSAVAETARSLAAGDLANRVAHQPSSYSAAEIDHLIADINVLGERLEAAEARMREDAASLAHELRTPLAALKGRVQAMVDGVFPATADECARLLPPIDRLTLLVEDLRTLSLARAKRLTLKRSPTDLSRLVQDLVEEVRPLCAEKNARLETDLAAVTAEIDAFRFRQVILNLIDNALRYGGNPPQLHLATGEREGRAEVVIADNGPGWPEGQQASLLDPFVRGEVSRARDSGGSGLGLAVVDALVRAHGGEVLLENGERGAVVRLYLPIAAPRVA